MPHAPIARPTRGRIMMACRARALAAAFAFNASLCFAAATVADPVPARTFMSHEFQPGSNLRGVSFIAVIDLDEDGQCEVLTSGYDGRLHVIPADGNRFGLARLIEGVPESAVILGADVDADEDTDVALVGRHGHLLLMRNDGELELSRHEELNLGEVLGIEDLRCEWATLVHAPGRDGRARADLIAIATSAGIVTVPLEPGGRFGAPTLLAPEVSYARRRIDAGDLNADGREDLVFVTGAPAPHMIVAIRTPAGSWTIRPAVPFESSGDIVLADCDGDGHLDLVSCEAKFDARILLRPGRGNGAFGPALELQTVPGTGFIDAADLDGDGLLEIVHSSINEPPGYGRITVLRGGPDGVPTPWFHRPGWPAAGPLSLGDVTGDGLADIAYTNWELSLRHAAVLAGRRGATPGNLTVSTAPGEMRQYVLFPAGGPGVLPDGVALLDGTMWVMANRGDGTFEPRSPQAVPDRLLVSAVVPREGRQRHLIVARTRYGDDQLHLLGRDGDSIVPEVRLATPESFLTSRLGAADVDGDGDIDLVAPADGTNGLMILRRERDRLVVEPLVTAAPDGEVVSVVRATDLDGDGWVDLLAATRERLTLIAGGPDGFEAFQTLIEFAEERIPSAIVMLDHDGDGLLDVLLTEVIFAELFRQVDPRSLESLGSLELPAGFLLAPTSAGDVDGDGDLDLVTWWVSSTTNAVIAGTGWYENRWDEGIAVPVLRDDGPAGNAFTNVRLADVDGDGRAEMVATTTDGGSQRGLAVSRRLLPPPTCAADLDADGEVDLDDLLVMLTRQGWSFYRYHYTGDVDADGIVDGDDLLALLQAWGPCPE